ncbi:MAG TPA: TatD family hydrolase [Candidatus Nanoarchaeia archaeon]|nr:TatD family hydrolase [Candidatus Nanoarchaeia archaeon]
MFVDAHCHLTHKSLKDQLPDVIKRAKEKGVVAVICSGVNVPTNREVLALHKKYPDFVKVSLGLYPIDLIGMEEESGLERQVEPFDLDDELKFIEKNKNDILAIGECGLDYHWDKTHHDEQKANFTKIIEFAKRINKPLIVHTRKAEADCIELLERLGAKKVQLHMFEGRKNVIKKAAELGFCFSIPAILYKSEHFKMLVDMVPITQLLTETDAPWMSPVMGKSNEPMYVADTVKEIARIKKLNPEEVEKILYLNYQRLFL